MRILMLDNEFPPLGGGMGTLNEALLRHFADVPGLEIDLITAALGAQSESEYFADRIRLFKQPVRNRNLHHSSNRELITYAGRALALGAKLHRAHPYDLCFAWSALPAGAVALALRRWMGLRYIVWVSGPDIPGFERRYRRIYPLLTQLIRAVWRHADLVIAKCEEEIAMIRRVDSRMAPYLIPNAVELAAFQPAPSIPDDGPLHVICVARLIERKGQEQLIQAARRLADEGIDITVSLVGTGDSLEAYRAMAASLGVVDRVRLVGYVPRCEIPQHLAAAHVFALPSYNEGMAVAALEAMAAGLPLVLTRTGGTGELVEEGVNGFTFAWADVDALVTHLRCLALDSGLARRMGAESRRRVERFSWETVAQQYLTLFNEHAAPIDSGCRQPSQTTGVLGA